MSESPWLLDAAPTRRRLLEGGFRAAQTLAVAAVFAPAFAHSETKPGPVVRTAEGVVRGASTEALNIFKGMRYAQSPAGAARFLKPKRVKRWRGVRDATALGPPAMQDNPDLPAWLDPGRPSEDCLFLNVWAPRTPGPHPVMVFFHGGGFTYGSGGIPMYDGGALAERGDVVVVTVNHRLNIFGYLYLAGLSARYADDANPGHRDLVEALRWVRRNIGAFGGDAGNVTIFGESGGGGKVSFLLGSPMAAGLFHKAIIQSGSVPVIRKADAATAEAKEVLSELGIPAHSPERLSRVPASELMRVCKKLTDRGQRLWDGMPFWPTLDAGTIPLQPTELAYRQRWKHIPLLVGYTEHEAAFLYALSGSMPEPKSDAEVIAMLNEPPRALDEARARKVLQSMRQRMPDASLQRLLVAIRSIQVFGADVIHQADLKAELGGAPVYAYRLDWQEAFMGGWWALHAAELPFVFDKLTEGRLWDERDAASLRAGRDPQGLRFKLRDGVIAAWSGFARGGVPGNPHLPAWPAYTKGERQVMLLDRESRVTKDPLGPELRQLMNI